jgi:putative phosphoribosyl transferase
VQYRDRRDAGRQLGRALQELRESDVVVLGLPRGGVPVAYEVARALEAPLDIVVVCKLGVPFQPELAMGAVGEDGLRILNGEVIRSAGVGEAELAAVERRERAEVESRARRFRRERPRLDLAGRIAVVVDDGIATGSTARAACEAARALGAARVVLGTPVGPPGTAAKMAGAADEAICLEAPSRFFAVGQWYRDFSQTSDEEVVSLLEEATMWPRGAGTATETAPPPEGPAAAPS